MISGLLAGALFLLQVPNQDWPAYGGGPEDIRYSTLKQINRANVSKLRNVWSYDTADGTGDPQTQPIVIDRVLYGLTPKHKVIALDAVTGKLLCTGRSAMTSASSRRCAASSMRWMRKPAR
jgi:quinoprotein glucose dehydrogenase